MRNWKLFTLALLGLLVAAAPTLVSATGPSTYVVRSGDTLSGIAVHYPGVTWRDICTANGLANCNLITVGLQLAIPAAAALTAPVVSYAGVAPAGVNPYEAAHRVRLEQLDPTFRMSGFEPWLKVAGFSWSTLTLRTDQIVEETWSGRQWASGVPVVITGLSAPWPNALTTDAVVPSGRCVRAGPSSQVCVDVVGFSGRATLYVDAQNWAQLAPGVAVTTTTPVTATPTMTGCLTLSQLGDLGDILQELEYPSGTLAGAQIRFDQDWTPPNGWVLHRGGVEVSSVITGEVASAWSPESCRPLAR